MTVQIRCIVEGHGEADAVPILIQRIAERLDPGLPIFPPRPIRVSRNQVVKVGELERVVELAARKIGGQGAIFILSFWTVTMTAQPNWDLNCSIGRAKFVATCRWLSSWQNANLKHGFLPQPSLFRGKED